MKTQASLEEALLNQACVSLRSGSRFQFRAEEIGGEGHVRRFVVKVSSMIGDHVRANSADGLVTVYRDNDTDGTSVTVATVKRRVS